jgi:hypothetical protein
MVRGEHLKMGVAWSQNGKENGANCEWSGSCQKLKHPVSVT